MSSINPMQKLFNKMKSLCYVFFHHTKYMMMFKNISIKARLYKPLEIKGAKNIIIEQHCIIAEHTWLAAQAHGNTKTPKLTIKEGCKIGHFNHIYCTGTITFEKNVLTADKVYISDNLHEYQNIKIPIFKQPIKHLKPMIIGEGSWIGENVCIIGANIGKGSVIGANSVVTKDIPDFCVAVGAPAKIIKKYNQITKQWEKTY